MSSSERAGTTPSWGTRAATCSMAARDGTGSTAGLGEIGARPASVFAVARELSSRRTLRAPAAPARSDRATEAVGQEAKAKEARERRGGQVEGEELSWNAFGTQRWRPTATDGT